MVAHEGAKPVDAGLSILLADEDPDALRDTEEVLRTLGHTVTSYAISVGEAAERIANEDPDVGMVVIHHDLEHALELIDELGEYARGPVVALLEAPDAVALRAAAERGVAAVARADAPADVQGALEIAVRRHAELARLAGEVEQLSGALERRGLIERAKGILMERHAVDERAAFAMLREQARGRNRRVVDVARAVIDGHALLPARPREPEE
jgi:response regulator NasT